MPRAATALPNSQLRYLSRELRNPALGFRSRRVTHLKIRKWRRLKFVLALPAMNSCCQESDVLPMRENPRDHSDTPFACRLTEATERAGPVVPESWRTGQRRRRRGLQRGARGTSASAGMAQRFAPRRGRRPGLRVPRRAGKRQRQRHRVYSGAALTNRSLALSNVARK